MQVYISIKQGHMKVVSSKWRPLVYSCHMMCIYACVCVCVDSIVRVIFKHQRAIHHPSISCVHSIPLSLNSSLCFVSLGTCCWAFLQHTADKYTLTVSCGSITHILTAQWQSDVRDTIAVWHYAEKSACTHCYPNAICSCLNSVYFLQLNKL